MRDIRDGQMVTICKHPAHALPVFVAGQRAIEITEEPTRINWNGYYETEGKMYFRQDQPLPFTLLGLFPQLVTQDRG